MNEILHIVAFLAPDSLCLLHSNRSLVYRKNTSCALSVISLHYTELQTIGSYGLLASKRESFRNYLGAAVWDSNSSLVILLSW